MKARYNRLRGREGVHGARIDYYSERMALRTLHLNILDDVVARMVGDIASEVYGVNEMAKRTAMNLIIQSITTQRELKCPYEEMKAFLV